MENIDQTNYEQDYSYQKVKTPAALFSKSSAKSPVNALRFNASPSASQLNYACENHSHKQAMYYTITDDEQLYFCQKCAATLASQGHNIAKIHPQLRKINSSSSMSSLSSLSPISMSRSKMSRTVKGRREYEIQTFLKDLNDLRGTVLSSKQSIKQKLIESQQFYGEQLEEINEYFSLIIKSLELQKHKCYNHILKERQEAEKSIRGIDHELQGIDQDITRILLDIEDNFDTVYSIDDDMYELVVGQYRKQQEMFHYTLNELLVSPIEMRRIEFQGVPESIYNLSDFLIQNSLKNKGTQHYRLVDSLTNEDLNLIHAISPRDQERDETPYRLINQAQSLKFSFRAEKLKSLGQSKQFERTKLNKE